MTDLLSTLRFVVHGVAPRDQVAEQVHLRISRGRVSAFDGLIAMAAPIMLQLEAKPHARKFYSTIAECSDKDGVQLHLTPAGRLAVRSGALKVFVDCLPDSAVMHQSEPEGDLVAVTPEFLTAIKTVVPFVGSDHRLMFNGVRLSGQAAYATNGLTLVAKYHGVQVPREAIIPTDAIKLLGKIKEPPTHIQLGASSITFHFAERKWMKTQLIEGKWPAKLDERLEAPQSPLEGQELAAMADALGRLAAVADSDALAYFLDGHVSTSTESDSEGASIAVPVPPLWQGAVFHLGRLRAVLPLCSALDLSAHPEPARLRGPGTAGIVAAVRER